MTTPPRRSSRGASPSGTSRSIRMSSSETVVGQVDALEAVDERPALDGDLPAHGVDARVRRDDPRVERELEDHLLAGLPGALEAHVARVLDRGVLAGHGHARAGAPGRDAQRERPLARGRVGDLEHDPPAPRVVRLDLHRDVAGAQPARRVLVHLQAAVVARGEVVPEARQQPHHVRWAAGARVPRMPQGAALPGVAMALAHLQRVHVGVAAAVEREAGEEAVVERALEQVGVARLARGEQHPPVPLHRGDRRARLAVAAVGRQLVGVAERLVAVVGAEAAGQVGLAAGHVGPPALHRREQLGLARLEVEVDDAGREVERPHAVALDLGRLAHGHAVLEVARAEAGVGQRAAAADVDEVLRALAVARLAGQPARARRARSRSRGARAARRGRRRRRSARRCGRRGAGRRRAAARPRGPRACATAAWMRWPAQ